MPTVLRVGPYRFYFFGGDRPEPPHVHAQTERRAGKFWLDPVRLAYAGKLSAKEQREAERIIRDHQQQLLEAWRDFFNW